MLRVQTDGCELITHTPLPLCRPHFLEENLNQNLCGIIAEHTFLPFAAVALGVTVVGYDDGFQSARASSLQIVHAILLEPTDY